tara:strand:+ start:200 stop:466 length:267 start_codon:yes stop_codon:yes gene_type:complete
MMSKIEELKERVRNSFEANGYLEEAGMRDRARENLSYLRRILRDHYGRSENEEIRVASVELGRDVERVLLMKEILDTKHVLEREPYAL